MGKIVELRVLPKDRAEWKGLLLLHGYLEFHLKTAPPSAWTRQASDGSSAYQGLADDDNIRKEAALAD